MPYPSQSRISSRTIYQGFIGGIRLAVLTLFVAAVSGAMSVAGAPLALLLSLGATTKRGLIDYTPLSFYERGVMSDSLVASGALASDSYYLPNVDPMLSLITACDSILFNNYSPINYPKAVLLANLSNLNSSQLLAVNRDAPLGAAFVLVTSSGRLAVEGDFYCSSNPVIAPSNYNDLFRDPLQNLDAVPICRTVLQNATQVADTATNQFKNLNPFVSAVVGWNLSDIDNNYALVNSMCIRLSNLISLGSVPSPLGNSALAVAYDAVMARSASWGQVLAVSLYILKPESAANQIIPRGVGFGLVLFNATSDGGPNIDGSILLTLPATTTSPVMLALALGLPEMYSL